MQFDLLDECGEYRWHTTASSDITGHGGQGYSRRIDCEQGAGDVAEAVLLGIGRERAEAIIDRVLAKWGDRRSLASLAPPGDASG